MPGDDGAHQQRACHAQRADQQGRACSRRHDTLFNTWPPRNLRYSAIWPASWPTSPSAVAYYCPPGMVMAITLVLVAATALRIWHRSTNWQGRGCSGKEANCCLAQEHTDAEMGLARERHARLPCRHHAIGKPVTWT